MVPTHLINSVYRKALVEKIHQVQLVNSTEMSLMPWKNQIELTLLIYIFLTKLKLPCMQVSSFNSLADSWQYINMLMIFQVESEP